MPSAVREKEMSVGSAVLRKVILDFESYPEFLKEVVSAKIQSGGTPKALRVDFELEIIKRFQYTLEFNFETDEEVAWRLHDGKLFTKNEGKWVLSPKGKDKTLARYEVEIALGFFVPGWVTKKLTENNLPQLLDSFEKRAKEQP